MKEDGLAHFLYAVQLDNRVQNTQISIVESLLSASQVLHPRIQDEATSLAEAEPSAISSTPAGQLRSSTDENLR